MPNGNHDEKSILNFYQGRGSLISQLTDSPVYNQLPKLVRKSDAFAIDLIEGNNNTFFNQDSTFFNQSKTMVNINQRDVTSFDITPKSNLSYL